MATEPANDDLESDRLQQLLDDARAGHEEARNRLFVLIQKYLDFVANRHHTNPALMGKVGVSDVVQQTMLQAAQEFPGFRGKTTEEFRGWLRQILVNEIRGVNRHFATQRRNTQQEIAIDRPQTGFESPLDLKANQPTPSREIMADESAARLHKILENLPEDMRLVVQLRNWEGLQFNQIAERMGISLSKAAKLWYQALIELERCHSELSDER